VAKRLSVLVVLLAVAVLPPRAAAQRREPSRIVAIGDIHGDFDALNGILQHAGIIDTGGRWTASDAVLVQVGDFTDRGPRVRAVMDLLMDWSDRRLRLAAASRWYLATTRS
jgi:hypothetical protein